MAEMIVNDNLPLGATIRIGKAEGKDELSFEKVIPETAHDDM